MATPEASVGRDGFVAEHGLWTDDQAAAARDAIARVKADGIELVRLAYPDQHGILRGKAVVADAFEQALRNGCGLTTTLLAKDTSHKTVYPVFSQGGGFGIPEMQGAGDFIMVPDPTTFRVLPWVPDTGWMLCDAYFQSGARQPFATRHILRDALDRLAARGWNYVTGIEIEFHLYKLDDPGLSPRNSTQPAAPPQVSMLAHGFNYLTEQRFDQVEPILALIRRQVLELGLPLRTVESEFGPGQVEFTFHPATGLASADTMMLFRSAVKQIARRNGCHATFMCKPGLPNAFASGWHLHQSLVDGHTGANLFIPDSAEALLSPLGRQFVAGLLKNARAASLFTTPTINGYKRFKPNSLAPDRAIWGRDNKGAMIRAVGGPGDRGTRVENRIGDPAANPYLYLASQIVCGLDGIENGLEPPAPTEAPYESDATRLPASLMEALAEARGSETFRAAFGAGFMDYITFLKAMEIDRFLSEVTDWEHREYFELY